ncbi:MAG: ferrous iron transport protein B, partial [Rectinema subterraneum]|uniref:ferrous iron transport protein B n=1 Tax=Rectinema subterraneum TaxID=2653714 RepID=UPI003C7CADA5
MTNTIQPATRTLRVALIGNPNSGKSTIFNALTGGNAHVGNWPGVTVEKKEGKFKYKDFEVDVTDLPGTYSLTPYSIDERIARDFIIRKEPDVVVCVTDATNLTRNMYLLILLRELGANTLLDLNMIDMVEGKLDINIEEMKKLLGIPVIKTVGTKGVGINELKEAIINAASTEPSALQIHYSTDIEQAIHEIELQLQKISSLYNKRFIALSLLQGDPQIAEEIKNEGFGTAVEAAYVKAAHLEKEFGFDLETDIIEKRYGFIESMIRQSTKKLVSLEDKLTISDKIDKVMTNRFLGIPIFALFMWVTFQLTFTIGGVFSDYIDQFFSWMKEIVGGIPLPHMLSSFIIDGLIGGIGNVFVFLPNILVLFLFLSFLEDVGYMARAAFVMDRVMHAIGLPGRSFVSMILGFGCNVPAIMSTRTISEEKDRLLTILINPFMSCTARLPIYTIFAGIFFSKNQGLVVFSLYTLGVIVAVLSAKLFRATIPSLKGKISPLVMELPPYRMPMLKGVFIHSWERSGEFLKKAGTIIFAGVVVVWLLSSFPQSYEYASEGTFIGRLGHIIAPLLKPAGFDFWQVGVALIFGIIAKEVVVGTFGTLFGGEENISLALQKLFTPLSAYSFMVMSLLYIPCIASIGAIYRETGSIKWAFFSIAYSLILGYVVAVLFYQIGALLF